MSIKRLYIFGLLLLCQICCVKFVKAQAHDLDKKTFEVYCSNGQKVVDGKKILRGTQLEFKIINVCDVKPYPQKNFEVDTYNFYYILNNGKRNYIAKDIKNSFVWDTSNLHECGDIEIHISVNKFDNDFLQENMALCKRKIHVVDSVEVLYISNYDESNVYSRRFLHEVNGEEIIKDNMFNRDGYTFFEWNEKPDGTGKTYDIGSKVVLNQNLDIYAIWKKEKYNSFDEEKSSSKSTKENMKLENVMDKDDCTKTNINDDSKKEQKKKSKKELKKEEKQSKNKVKQNNFEKKSFVDEVNEEKAVNKPVLTARDKALMSIKSSKDRRKYLMEDLSKKGIAYNNMKRYDSGSVQTNSKKETHTSVDVAKYKASNVRALPPVDNESKEKNIFNIQDFVMVGISTIIICFCIVVVLKKQEGFK